MTLQISMKLVISYINGSVPATSCPSMFIVDTSGFTLTPYAPKPRENIINY